MLSLVYSMWNPTPGTMETHLKEWSSYSKMVRRNIEIILVDDCSTPAININPPVPLNLTIARITDNIYWNICGAKNLGFHLAKGPWIFSTDQDHLFYREEDLINAINIDKRRKTVYFLTRLKPDGSLRGKNHPNTFIMHKEDFNYLGGYDEDFSGNRGWSDRMLDLQLDALKFERITLPIRIREHKEFTCVDPRNRNYVANTQLVYRKELELRQGIYKNGPLLRFNWEIVKQCLM